MTTILIIGGYGAVGRHTAAALTGLLPDATVLTAGRHPERAAPITGTAALRLDAADPDAMDDLPPDVDTVVMCAARNNARIAQACLERGIHYLDVSASHAVLDAIEPLDPTARRTGATAVLSVGLLPGVSNLLARHLTDQHHGADLRISALLGSGDRHGPAALDWTLDGLGRLHDSWAVDFPAPYGRRTVHHFPFSDQYTLPATTSAATAATGLCLDSRLVTGLLHAAGQPAVARLLRHPGVRRRLLAALNRAHFGGDGFAVTVHTGDVAIAFSGRDQSRATGLAAALAVTCLQSLQPGVFHLDQVVAPIGFLERLAAHGSFTLHPLQATG
ncbi:saccharopine dehydrogenase NADP-binding domain-containing protein [Streptomyces sp. RY43-2]|uniref:Saccharopine dehydrogenase NADP-binding domain-containing protein n=1 Tax=Streptomyces macrolidinus TaxID=2952607 RepID=A0ABT0ZMJ4_9ACTN|nr:saccharopine dehydrogenase NADP-binding domain-containing protein [Streptomyces macrolidinus]MCN9244798.1 saccharopine dehydrogenase NADP-binding domain-containing protein [Streptomyces macrolidinus]